MICNEVLTIAVNYDISELFYAAANVKNFTRSCCILVTQYFSV